MLSLKKITDYHSSFYNIVLPITRDGDIVVWNSKSGAIIAFENEVWEEIGKTNYSEDVLGKYFDALVKNGIIVPKGLNEFNSIKFEALKGQFSIDSDCLTFVIAPTLNCNFRCSYCFENSNRKQATMDLKIIDDVLQYVQNTAMNRKVEKIKVRWFGGEPLMSYSTVMLPFSKKMVQWCVINGVGYESAITTNGFYLDEPVVDGLLQDCYVRSFQISIDGCKEEYCRRKGASSSAFDNVIDNIFTLSRKVYETGVDSKIHIRLNSDNANKQSVIDFYKMIRSDSRFHDNLSFYIGQVINYETSCYRDDDVFTLSEYEEFERDFDRIQGKNRIRYFKPKRTWCLQHTLNCICIGPEGELYKCEHDFGDTSRVVGSVREGFTFPEYLFKFMFQEPKAQCKNCKIFPVCLCGCPSINLSSKNPVCCSTMQKAIDGACNRYYYKTRKNKQQGGIL